MRSYKACLRASRASLRASKESGVGSAVVGGFGPGRWEDRVCGEMEEVGGCGGSEGEFIVSVVERKTFEI